MQLINSGFDTTDPYHNKSTLSMDFCRHVMSIDLMPFVTGQPSNRRCVGDVMGGADRGFQNGRGSS